MKKKNKQTNKQTNKQNKNKNKPYQLHGCLKLEEVFYLLQNTGANFKSNWQCCAAMHAIYCGWLVLTVTESRSVQPYKTTRNTDCEWPKNADLAASCTLRNLTISQPNYHQNTSKYMCNVKKTNNVYSR